MWSQSTEKLSVLANRCLRLSCLRWISHHVDLLNLRRRSRELILYLADALLARTDYQVSSPEVVCVACMFFVMKLETDVNDLVADFFHFVTEEQGISIRQIREAEYNVLQNLPDGFGLCPTLSDILSTVLLALSNKESPSPINLDFLSDLYIRHFIDYGPDYAFLAKCISRAISIFRKCSSYSQAPSLSLQAEVLDKAISSKHQSFEKLMLDQHVPPGSKRVKL